MFVKAKTYCLIVTSVMSDEAEYLLEMLATW